MLAGGRSRGAFVWGSTEMIIGIHPKLGVLFGDPRNKDY